MNQENYDPSARNAEIEGILKDIGRTIKSSLPPEFGFAVEIFRYEGGDFFYLSSGNREDMIKALEELVNRMKERAA